MMDPFVRGFIRAALAWLGIGVLIGIAMSFWPMEAVVYRTAHAHANLLGFVSMMIFGVAYHVIPRFSGNPLRSRVAASVHLYVANVGLFLLVGGWVARSVWPAAAPASIRAGALLSALGAFLFIGNIWRTIGPAVQSPVATEGPTLVPLSRGPVSRAR